jgi:calcineurin-like phosphoesterase family protein
MNYWIITDTHFGHKKMQEYCGRPEGFEETIIKNIHHTVQYGDVLIHLGDFCIYKDEEWHERFMANCAGKRWLIRGNHDKKSLGWYFDHGWDCVADEITLAVFGKSIIFSHRPTASDKYDLNIHGHMHNTGHHPEMIPRITPRSRLIIMEHHYSPMNLRRIVES